MVTKEGQIRFERILRAIAEMRPTAPKEARLIEVKLCTYGLTDLTTKPPRQYPADRIEATKFVLKAIIDGALRVEDVFGADARATLIAAGSHAII